MKKETWGTKLMLILAVAGGAIGLGNFLRFPTLFAQYGGWFLVPYFVSFFILGVPLMYVEWTLGIMGRDENKHSLFTLLDVFFNKKRSYRIFSVLAVLCVLIIGAYYIYMESWMLGYSVLSLEGVFKSIKPENLNNFLNNYIGFKLGTNATVISIICIVVCAFINMYMSAKDVTHGIGKFINWCMPALAVMCVIMLIKVFCTDNIVEGLKYMMRGEPSSLLNVKMWVAAASQMFFSLSVGFTATMVYVTYSNDDVDIKKDGFCCSNMNMLTEVFLASFLSVPIGFLAFGPETTKIAESSTYCFGMVAMPSMFQDVPLSSLWCFLWFFLLFIAALASSLSIFQVFVSYISDYLNVSKLKSIMIQFIPYVILLLATVLIPCAIDEFDFWTNTIILPVLALFLIFLVHKFGDKYWKTFDDNCKRKSMKFERILIKYITPIYVIIIVVPYIFTSWKQFSFGPDATWEARICRILIILCFVFYGVIIKVKEKKDIIDKAESRK